MKAVRFDQYGGPEVLRIDDVEEPHAAAGQVRVAIRAAGVNPVDWKIRSGAMSAFMPVEFPRILGSDAAGVVDEVGDGVNGTSVGDEVFGSAVGGATSDYAVLDHWAAKPDGLSWAEAAGLPVAVETALRVLKLLGCEAGQTLIINGAAGGVGIAAVQFARELGVRVIGTASASNHDFLRKLGAEPTTYGDGLVERVRAILPNGVDRAFDAAGHGTATALVELTGNPDNVVTIADFAAAEQGVRVSPGAEGRSWEALGQAAELFEAGRFTMPVARTFAFSEAAEAHRVSEDGHVRGKLVLVPDALADG